MWTQRIKDLKEIYEPSIIIPEGRAALCLALGELK
jgi:hypothetical protein